jgi:hypothetical protein
LCGLGNKGEPYVRNGTSLILFGQSANLPTQRPLKTVFTNTFLLQLLDFILPADVGAFVGVGRELGQVFDATAERFALV